MFNYGKKLTMKNSLSKILKSKKTSFFMEAHNGISAKLVTENKFDGIWASGLTISASMGLRDVNEMSWSQVCDILNYITLSSDLPVLLDADTGYGSFNNTIHLVKHLKRINVQGICIEDKIFPKKNSFFQGNKQPLEEIDIFSGKIKAIKDKFPEMQVVARVESLIAGWGLDEAVKRAEAYKIAGADAILIHSKKKDISEIDQFLNMWNSSHPIVLVPTTYYNTDPKYFTKKKINIVIWANHLLRTSISSMSNILKIINKEKSLKKIENKVFPVKDIFKITDMDKLSSDENKYLPKKNNLNAIILAATQGTEFGNLTKSLPKSLIELNNKPILNYQIDVLNKTGIKDISVVSGFKKEKFKIPNVKLFFNSKWKSTSSLFSLWKAKENLANTIISFGDIIYSEKLIKTLSQVSQNIEDIVILCDNSWMNDSKDRNYYTGVKCRIFKNKNIFKENIFKVLKLKTNLNKKDANGEFVGLLKVSTKGSLIFKKHLNHLNKSNKLKGMTLENFINYLIEKNEKVYAKYVDGGWLDIDNDKLLFNAENYMND